MPWVESHSILIEHRKVREVARELNIKPVHLIGHLHCLWHKVIELNEDGDISSWTTDDIAYYARWEGDPDTFYKALKGRFIDENIIKKRGAKGYTGEKIAYTVLHDWLDYAWKYLHSKYKTSNPSKLEVIKNKYKSKPKTGIPLGQPKEKTKGRPLDRLPNLPNQPSDKYLVPSKELATLLAELILKNNPSHSRLNNSKYDSTVASWAKDIEKMIRIDEQPIEEIERIIRWCQADIFWQGNILSGNKLRKQFDQLVMKANQQDNTKDWKDG